MMTKRNSITVSRTANGEGERLLHFRRYAQDTRVAGRLPNGDQRLVDGRPVESPECGDFAVCCEHFMLEVDPVEGGDFVDLECLACHVYRQEALLSFGGGWGPADCTVHFE